MTQQESTRFSCTVLGRVQDGGVPHFGCARDCCKNGIEHPTCLGIFDAANHKRVLIEATPSIAYQVSIFDDLTKRKGKPPFDALLITHGHIGHYAGLLQLGKEVGCTQSIPTYVTERMASLIEGNLPWSQLVKDKNIELHIIKPNIPFEPIDDLKVEPFLVEHRDDFTDTLAFKITGENQTVLFAPDIDSNEGLEALLEHADVAYIDGTFFDDSELPNRDINDIPHPLMKDSVKNLQPYLKSHTTDIRFIHLNHSNPALHDITIQNSLDSAGFKIAQPYESIVL